MSRSKIRDFLDRDDLTKEERYNLAFDIYETAYVRGMASAEKPRGEWRDFSDDGYVECPFCEHATNCDDNIEELHYCFFCGAELRKSGEEE